MHFKQDREYSFSELLLYGFRAEEQGNIRLSAFIMEDENGWEAEFILSETQWRKALELTYPALAEKCAGLSEVFFPDITPDPPVWEAAAVRWKYLESYTDADDMFGDETIYVFGVAG